MAAKRRGLPLNRRAAAQGDLKVRVATEGGDEVEQLGQRLNPRLERLHGLLGEARSAAPVAPVNPGAGSPG